jgi:hypothetical protein
MSGILADRLEAVEGLLLLGSVAPSSTGASKIGSEESNGAFDGMLSGKTGYVVAPRCELCRGTAESLASFVDDLDLGHALDRSNHLSGKSGRLPIAGDHDHLTLSRPVDGANRNHTN